jgi:hypothetical protein
MKGEEMKRLVLSLVALCLAVLASWTAPEPAFACSCLALRNTTQVTVTGATCSAAKDNLFQTTEAMMICQSVCYMQLYISSTGPEDGCWPRPDGTYEVSGFMRYRCWSNSCGV